MNNESKGFIHQAHEKVKPLLEGARNIVNTARYTIRQYIPGASEPEIVKLSGDAFVDKTKHDIEQAKNDGDGSLTPEAREGIIHDDITPAVLSGIDEARFGMPIKENAVFGLEAQGNQELVTEAVADIATEDPETAVEAAELADEASETLGQGAAAEHDASGGLAELEKQYEQTFTRELGTSFAECLATLSPDERQLIHNNPKLRNQVAKAVEKFGVEDVLGVGGYEKDGEYVGKPETMERSAKLVAAAERVNGTFQTGIEQIARVSGNSYKAGPIKLESRIAQKAEIDYKGNVSEVKDAVRSRIILAGDPIADDGKLVDLLRSSGHEVALDPETGRERIKRGFIDKKSGQPLPPERQNRYLDTKVTLNLPDPETGEMVLAEVVIATPEMAAATNTEHPLYEIIRSFDSEETNPTTIGLEAKLQTISANFYLSVSGRLSERLSSAA